MRNNKCGVVTVFVLVATVLCGSTMAFGQNNIPGFRGMNKHQKEVQSAPSPANTPTSPNMNCTLILPKAPLTAVGLSTPFRLTATDPADGPCNEANSAQSAFAQAAILDLATGQVSIYNPLVIDDGTRPAAPPVVPVLPRHAVVALLFGYNADNLTLAPSVPGDLEEAGCVNGLPGSIFSQVSYCNTPAFFAAANAAISEGSLKIPELGTALDGLACPTVRDFFIVDQDQSDNLPTLYLITSSGQLAQYTQKNLAAFPGATVLGNASDNHLTDAFVDPVLGCKPFTAPDLADPGQYVAAQALNELSARTLQATPVALVPDGDPMAQVSGTDNLIKTNLYRLGVDQPIALSVFDVDTARYCRQMVRIAPARMFNNQARLATVNSPVASAANNLFTFMAQRFVASYELLNCESLIQIADPITVTTDPTTGIATAASLNQLSYQQEVASIASEQAADNAADSAAKSREPVE